MGNTVSVINESDDANTGNVTATIPVGRYPNGLAVDSTNHNVYLTSSFDNDLSVIDESGDASTGRVTATIPVGVGLVAVAVDPTNHNVYVANSVGTVSVINESGDASTGKVTATIPVGVGSVAVAVDPTNHNVYVANSVGTVSVINESGDASTGKVSATIPVGGYPNALAVDPTNHNVYVSNYGYSPDSDGSLVVINESGGANAGHVTAIDNGGNDSIGLTVDPTTHNLYVTNTAYGTPAVAVIDESGDSNTGTATASIPVGQNPWGIAVDPATHDLYVTNFYAANGQPGDTVSVVSTTPVDLDMTISGPAAVADGSTFTETVTVTDYSPYPASDITTDLLIPAGLHTTGPELDINPLTWTDATISSGKNVTYTVHLTVAKHNGYASETVGGVTISSRDYDPMPANNAALTTIYLRS